MNYKTKAVLYLFCQILRDVEENAYYAHMLAWEIYGALVDTNPEFAERFRDRKGALTQRMIHEHAEMIQKLDEVLQLLGPNQ